MSGEEDIQSNAFFNFLQDDDILKNIVAEASTTGVLICVPQSPSIVDMKLTTDLAQSHILQPQTDNEAIFLTLNGKQVEKKDKQLITLDGFTVNRIANVLFEETHYTETFESFSVICIDQPLEGRMTRPIFDVTRMLQEAETRRLVEHKDYMQELLGSSFMNDKSVLGSPRFRFFMNEFPILAPRYVNASLPNTRGKITEIVQQTCDDSKAKSSIAKFFTRRWDSPPEEVMDRELWLAIDSLVMAEVYQALTNKPL